MKFILFLLLFLPTFSMAANSHLNNLTPKQRGEVLHDMKLSFEAGRESGMCYETEMLSNTIGQDNKKFDRFCLDYVDFNTWIGIINIKSKLEKKK